MDGRVVSRRAAVVASATMAMLAAITLPAAASCVYQSPAEQFAGADVVFEGTAEPGPSTNGMLLSPATFAVARHLKGQVSGEVPVTTGVSIAGDGLIQMISTGITPEAGERWRIYATTEPGRGALITSACHGSHGLGEAAAADHRGDEPVGASGHGATPPDGPARSWPWTWIGAAAAGGIVTSAVHIRRGRSRSPRLP